MIEELKKIISPFLNELACSGDVIDTLNPSGAVVEVVGVETVVVVIGRVVVVSGSRQHLSSQHPYPQFFTSLHL